jgi:hypothetical protein
MNNAISIDEPDPLPLSVSAEVKDIVSKLLYKNPDDRPDAN